MADDPTNQPSAQASDRAPDPQGFSDEPFGISEAQEAVRRAEAGLKEARRLYRRARRRAVHRLHEVRQTTAGDLIDHTLKLVKKYPGPSVVAALFLGFFLGRSSRR